MQRYQKSEKLGIIVLNVTVLICQINAACVFFEGLDAVNTLPPSLRASYNIYNALDTAPARPLLPFKRYSEVLLLDSEYNLTDVDLLPCGTGGAGAGATVAPALAPRWALETNNAGLNAFYENQVCVSGHSRRETTPPPSLRTQSSPRSRAKRHRTRACRCA